MQEYLNGLNEPQREAVTHIKGPLMIVAGAGSGKTKVLTTRIAHLMNSVVDAFNIMEDHSITQLVVVDEGEYKGVIHLHDILKEGIV